MESYSNIWEIYAYWNTVELRGVFEAIAMLTQSNDFLGLVSSMVLFALMVVGLAIMVGNMDLTQAWKWFFGAIAMYYILLVPKTNVAIIDRTGLMPPTVIENVPLSLAVLGHVTSKIGDYLSTSLEDVFENETPGYTKDAGLTFVGNGLMFGHQIIEEAEHLSSKNVAFRTNMISFFKKCVQPEFDTGNISITTLYNTNDIWSNLSNVNPSLYVQLYKADGSPDGSPVSCRYAYDKLSINLSSETNNELTVVGEKMYPTLSSSQARNALISSLAGTYEFMFNLSSSATDIFKQRLVANLFENSGVLDLNDIYAKTQTETLASRTYKTNAEIAKETMPKLRNIIEGILYAVFPIVLIMAIVAGFKSMGVLKNYLIVLVSIQLWAPMYVITNYFINSYRKSQFLAATDPSDALSVMQSYLISSGAQTDMDIAGMLLVSIPVLALALAKGGEMALTSFVSQSMAPIQQAANRAATDVATGNLSMGNVSMDNHSAANTSAMRYDMQPMVNNGPSSMTDRSGIKSTHTGDGRTFLDTSSRQNNGAMFNLMRAIERSKNYQKLSEQALESAYQHTVEAMYETSSALAHSGAFAAVASNSTAWGKDLTRKYGSNVQETLADLQSVSHNLANKLGISQSEAADLTLGVSAALSTSNTKLSASLLGGLEKKYGEKAVSEAQKSIQSMDQNDLRNAYSFIDDVSHNESLQSRFNLSGDAKTELNASQQKAESYRKQAKAELKEAEKWSEKQSEEEKVITKFETQVGALLDMKTLTEQDREFLEKGGQELLNKAYEAKINGDEERSQQYMREYEREKQDYLSHSPVGGVNVNNVKGPGNRDQVTNDHNEKALKVEQVHKQNKGDVNATNQMNQVRNLQREVAGQASENATHTQENAQQVEDEIHEKAAKQYYDLKKGKDEVEHTGQVEKFENGSVDDNNGELHVNYSQNKEVLARPFSGEPDDNPQERFVPLGDNTLPKNITKFITFNPHEPATKTPGFNDPDKEVIRRENEIKRRMQELEGDPYIQKVNEELVSGGSGHEKQEYPQTVEAKPSQTVEAKPSSEASKQNVETPLYKPEVKNDKKPTVIKW